MRLCRGTRMHGFLLACFVEACSLCMALPSPGGEDMLRDEDALVAVEELLARFAEAVNTMPDYSCTFIKREWKGGKQLPEEVIFLKYRAEPRSVYMKWTGPEKKGQELLWRPDWNDGNIRVHPGGLGSFVAVDLDPLGTRATAWSRHPVTESGFPSLLRTLRENLGRLKEDGASGLRFHRVPGRGECECIVLELPKWKNPSLYCYRTELCLQRETALPKHLRNWDFEDGTFRLVEEYGYENLKGNPGFTDEDFSPENPAYTFPSTPSLR